jgi:Fe-S oxidoreductase
MTLSLRSLTLIGMGFSTEFTLPFLKGSLGFCYGVLKDYIELIVLVACVVAIIRRVVFRPSRYSYPGGKGHEKDALIILGLVSALMVTDMLFEGSEIAIAGGGGPLLPAGALGASLVRGLDGSSLNAVHLWSYWLHILIFFFFLCYLPLSKHFHVITAIPNVLLLKLNRGSIKPVDWTQEDLDQIEVMGVGSFEGFTWKHILDFFSCADCGRCSDQCPATTVGRPLSPRMITIKARDYGFGKYPVFGKPANPGDSEFIGDIITEGEIWACTTCGACERECPIFIEYIDKIVDMRRFLVDEGRVPKTLQKPLMDIQKKGNAYGRAASKRAAWIEEMENGPVRIIEEGQKSDLLFFVDSCASFDPRIQQIARSFCTILDKAGINMGILGPDETDSGHEVMRIGEEGLFQELAAQNIEAFKAREFEEIVTIDPHAFNAIKNDYPESFKVLHYTQLLAGLLEKGKLKFDRAKEDKRIFTFHDPCYLGRHNNIYDAPRQVLMSIPGLELVEMKRSRSNSFCCGGGGLLLWYEAEEEEMRVGEKRVEMADEVGAEVIVTTCPFCLINIEDAIKTSGKEGKIEVIDLAELVEKSLLGVSP